VAAGGHADLVAEPLETRRVLLPQPSAVGTHGRPRDCAGDPGSAGPQQVSELLTPHPVRDPAASPAHAQTVPRILPVRFGREFNGVAPPQARGQAAMQGAQRLPSRPSGSRLLIVA
jgi:hypothetical protein